MARKINRGLGLVAATIILAGAAQASAETRFAVQDPTGTTDKMVVTDKGYIGVGTNAPATAIQAKGNSYETTQILSHCTGTDSQCSGGYLAYRNGLNGTTSILPKKGDRVGYMLFGSVDSNGAARNGGGLVGFAENDWTSTSIPTTFLFEVAAPGTTTRTERMRITGSGNIGIGTATPSQKLEVNGAMRLNTTAVKPATCTSALRGTIWMTQGGTGVADALEVCVKDANGNYSWFKLN